MKLFKPYLLFFSIAQILRIFIIVVDEMTKINVHSGEVRDIRDSSAIFNVEFFPHDQRTTRPEVIEIRSFRNVTLSQLFGRVQRGLAADVYKLVFIINADVRISR